MSEPTQAPPHRPSIALSIILALIGVILLLPGVCSIVFMVIAFQSPGSLFGELVTFWAVGFAVSAGGVALIVSAIRRHRPPR